MRKKFDAASKQLMDAHPVDWGRYLAWRVGPDGEVYLDFKYGVVRVWEEPLQALLDAGLGLLPLALLTNEARADLPAAFRQVEERLKQAGPPAEQARDLRGVSFVLLGL